MSTRRTITAITLTALATAAAGCGGGGGPESAATDFFKAGANGDGEKVCAGLTKERRDELTKALKAAKQDGGCAKGLSKILDSTTTDESQKEVEKAISDGKITTKEDGDKATVSITYKGDTQKVNMVKEDGDWKVDQSLTGGSSN